MESDEALGIPTYVSLCSGYDGIGLGLKRVIPNLQTLAHVEIEAYAIAGLIAKMETGQLDACPVFSDIKHFPFRELRGRIGILSAGFPCQPFSSAGRRQSTEDPRHIYPWIADGISLCLPQYVFLENVRGIVSAKTADGESVLKYVLGDLESRGYRTEWGLFSAEETGAPHQRIRCFILAYTPDLGQEWSSRPNQESSSHTIEGCGDRSPTAGQLGNPASERPRGGRENREGEQSEVFGTGLESNGKLAHTASREPRQSQARNGGQDIGGGSEEELGNSARLDGKQSNGETDQVGRTCEEDRGSSDVRGTRWPARPGEEQYEWEEPRVTEAQSELGGTVDGTRSGVDPTAEGVDAIVNRVDRLRLLGNGVVSACAELAWRTLWKELNEKR
jgi:DNA (cytosine-5)-methyltransferase 1